MHAKYLSLLAIMPLRDYTVALLVKEALVCQQLDQNNQNENENNNPQEIYAKQFQSKLANSHLVYMKHAHKTVNQ